MFQLNNHWPDLGPRQKEALYFPKVGYWLHGVGYIVCSKNTHFLSLFINCTQIYLLLSVGSKYYKIIWMCLIYIYIYFQLHDNDQQLHISNNNCNLLVVAREDTVALDWQPASESIVFAHTFLQLEPLNSFTWQSMAIVSQNHILIYIYIYIICRFHMGILNNLRERLNWVLVRL